jgi:type I restriction enzyme S subunit
MKEGALHELPGGWVWTRLGEICFTTSGGTPSRKNINYFGGNIPWLKSGELNNGLINSAEESITEDALKNSSAKIIPKGTLLVALYGATVGKLGILGFDSAINQAVCAISTKNSIDQKFLFWYLSGYRNKLLQARVGGAQPNISQQIVNDVQIPLPPLPEQSAIVSKIEQLFSDLDNGIENFKKAQAQLKHYRRSVLKAACEGKIVQNEAELARAEGRDYEVADVLLARILKERREKWNGKGKYKEPSAPDMTGLPKLTEGWCWASLPQLGELARGKSKHRPRDDKNLYGGHYPFIQTGDIRNSNGKIKNFSQTYNEFGLAQSRLWPAGTLCITIAANIADSSLLTFPSCFPDSVVGFVCEEKHCDIRFIEFFIRTAKKDLEKYAPATAQKNINLETLQNLAIVFPPLAEQRRIVAEVEHRLAVCDKMEVTITESLLKAESLRQSILKKAFEGRLLNKNELEKARNAPDWEPAEKLLERIRQEKQIKEKNNKTARRIK